MAKKKKYYVVWKGKQPGIYNSWKECKKMISGYKRAQYKSFTSFEEAKKAFNSSYALYKGKNTTSIPAPRDLSAIKEINMNSIAVDAASSGNPGKMEYRGVDTKTGKQLFHIGPFELGTNNIGEFLALVHGLAFLDFHKSNRVIYTDSRIAMSWVRQKRCKTTLVKNSKTEKLFELIDRAEKWLKSNSYHTTILKWNTRKWGEIPADFGRK